VGDVPGLRHLVHEDELDPLDVSDDRASHSAAALHVSPMMTAVMAPSTIPPFERFYTMHRDEVLGYLRRLLGQRAEDAWQETFLRALRAYGRLEHGRHLRAWVFTIATNVALDELRVTTRAVPQVDLEPAVGLQRDAFRELEHLTGGLPPTERAAVVLRYGYDLPYAQIADALGSSEEAARAAASSGVRRLRRTHERDH
jgi:RNA polymerase sigma factor (sigma-70 family)